METNLYEKNNKILYIDDEPLLLQAFKTVFRKSSLDVHIFDNPMLIEDYLRKHGPFAVVLTDQRMAERTGTEVLEIVSTIHPDTVKILVTGFSDFNNALEALNKGGISQYISKPWNDTELIKLVNYYIEKYNLKIENKYLFIELNDKNKQLQELFEGTLAEIVNLLSNLINYVNSEASSQTNRLLAMLDEYLPLFSEVNTEDRLYIKFAVKLINLGIALLPSEAQVAVSKNGLAALSKIPAAQNHHLLAAKVLEGIPKMDKVAKIIKYHQKNFDGSGEPSFDFINGKFLPFGSRLIKIFMDFDRLVGASATPETLIKNMLQNSSKYDVDILNKMYEKIVPPNVSQPSVPFDYNQFKSVSGLDSLIKEQHFITESGAKINKSDLMKQDKKSFIFRCHLDQLVEGLIILDDIVTESGIKLMSSYTEITKHELDFLRVWKRTHTDKITSSVRVRVVQ